MLGQIQIILSVHSCKLSFLNYLCRLSVVDAAFEKEENMCEVRNEGLKAFFITKQNLWEPSTNWYLIDMGEVIVGQGEVLMLVKTLGVRMILRPYEKAEKSLEESK